MRWHHCLWWNSEFSTNIDLPHPLLENVTAFKIVIQIPAHNSWHSVMQGVIDHIKRGLFSTFRMEQVHCPLWRWKSASTTSSFSLRSLLGKHTGVCQVLSVPSYLYLTAPLLFKSILWTSFIPKTVKVSSMKAWKLHQITVNRGFEVECPGFGKEILQIQQFSSIRNITFPWGLHRNWSSV